MRTMTNNPSHHVAWADRIGLNKTWAKAIERIWATYGTESFHGAVWGLHIVIVNIEKGPQLKTKINNHIQKLREDKNKKLELYLDEDEYDSEDEILEKEMLPDIAYFMIQLLENNGFGMYKSNQDQGSGKYIEIDDEE